MFHFPPFNFDINLIQKINDFHLSWLDPIMVFIANASEYAGIWILITVYFLLSKKSKTLFLTLAIALIIEVIINDGILKHIFFRERPYLLLQNIHHLGPNWTNSSFVSGHTASSTAALIILIDYLKNYSKKYVSQPFFIYYLLFIIFFLIVWSRLYLGMHYPTDIFGGVIVGAIATWLTFLIFKKRIRLIK